LHLALMANSRRARTERSQVPPAAGSRVLLSRIEPVLSTREFPDHHPPSDRAATEAQCVEESFMPPWLLRTFTIGLSSESEQHTERRAIEREVPHLEADDVGFSVLEAAEVAHVAAQADVIAEVPHDSGARVEAEVVLRDVCDAAQRRHVLLDQADADRHIRP